MRYVGLGRQVCGLLLALAMLAGCTTKRVSEREVVGASRQRLVRGTGAPVAASFRVDDGIVVGSVVPAPGCVREEERDVEVEKVTTTEGDTLANLVWLGAGVAMLAGSAYVFVEEVPAASANEQCSVNDQGEEVCTSDRATLQAVGGVLIAGGAIATTWGGVGLFADMHREQVEKQPAQTRKNRGGGPVACFQQNELTGLIVRAKLPDGSSAEGQVGETGEVRIPLPAGAPGGQVRLVVGAAPPTVEGRIAEGVELGLARVPETAPEAVPGPTAEPAAEPAVEWSGEFHGDRRVGSLVTTCRPRGPEQCSNAIDDDCDGAYDDASCGYASGLLQWTLVWQGPADLDLHVIDPNGEEVWSRHRRSGSGLMMDRDCKGSSGDGTCVENIRFSPGSEPPSGTYRGFVVVQALGTAATDQPISLRLGGRVGKRTWYNDVKLAPATGARYLIAFPVGPDADGDGVGDGEDACPTTAGRWFEAKDARGCPDGDEDGVPDKLDTCRTQPGLSQADPKRNGCPLVFGDARVTNFGVSITSRIEFDTGRATLRASAKKTLENVARAILARPGKVKRMAIEGHTDDVGTRQKNLILSKKRAQAVVDFLVRRGVPRASMVARGFADLRPMADNDTAQGKQANRRVEFVVVEPKPQAMQHW